MRSGGAGGNAHAYVTRDLIAYKMYKTGDTRCNKSIFHRYVYATSTVLSRFPCRSWKNKELLQNNFGTKDDRHIVASSNQFACEVCGNKFNNM